MKGRYIFLLLVLLFVMQYGHAQQSMADLIKKVPASGKSNTAFVPKGWKVAHKMVADFNGDNINDIAMIAEGNALIEGATSKDQVDMMRMTLVLLGNASGYQLSVKMPLQLNSDAPAELDSLAARNGKLVFCFGISTYPNMSGLDLAYRYTGSNWILAGFTKDYYVGDEGVKNPPHMLKIFDAETGATEEYQFKGKTRTLKKKYKKAVKAPSPISDMNKLDVYNL